MQHTFGSGIKKWKKTKKGDFCTLSKNINGVKVTTSQGWNLGLGHPSVSVCVTVGNFWTPSVLWSMLPNFQTSSVLSGVMSGLALCYPMSCTLYAVHYLTLHPKRCTTFPAYFPICHLVCHQLTRQHTTLLLLFVQTIFSKLLSYVSSSTVHPRQWLSGWVGRSFELA